MVPAPEKSMKLIKQVLGEDYLHLEVSTLSLRDDMCGRCNATVELVNGLTIQSTGVGQVNAIFNAFKDYYAEEYQSLKTIELADFSVTINKKGREYIDGTDAPCRVFLEIKNSGGNYFDFVDASHSLLASTGRSVAAVAEFFINSERAYVILYRALQDARERNRQDLVTRYEHELGLVVQNTSYAEVIDKIRKDVGV